MDSIKWGQPSAFWLLMLILIWMALYFVFEKTFQKKLEKSFHSKILPWLRSSVSFKKRRLILILQLVAFFFFIISLARPQMGQSEQEVKSEGVELMVLADVSKSMLADDFKPNRLEQMKIDLNRFLDLMPGNKTGIIAFAGSAVLISPLTSDPGAMKMYVDSLDTETVTNQGTSFESALSYAKEAFDKGGVTQTDSSKATRVILIASDGEDQEEGALEEAKKLAKDGVKIMTVAYGTEKGSTIPERDRWGNLNGTKKDKSGQTVISTVKGDFLKSLAQAGSGSFYYSQISGDHLKQIVNEINLFEKAQYEASTVVQYDEKFMWPLAIGFILFVMSLFISDREKNVSVWHGRYEYND